MPLFAYIYDRSQVTTVWCCRRAVTMLFRRVLTAQFSRPKSSPVTTNTVLDFEEIPSPKGLPIVGTTLSFLAHGSSQKLHKYIDKRHKELGPIFKERLGPVNCVFISDPDVIRDVYEQEGRYPIQIKPEPWVAYNQMYGCPRGLFFMDGPNWWHYRRIMNKLLLKGDLSWIYDSCDCVSDNLIQRLHDRGDPYFDNLRGTLYRWSLDVIVSVLLGAETYKKHSEELEEQITNLAEIVHLVFQKTAKLYVIPVSFAAKFKIPQWKRFVESVDQALQGANSLVATLTKLNPTNVGLLPKLTNEKVDLENIKRIIVDLILAAGDTSAVSLEWILYLTAKNSETQQKLRMNPDLSKHVMREALRLYPIAAFLTRILPEDSILAGYGVPKNTLVCMSIFTTGRDERYFKDSDSFKPERWDRKDLNYNIDMQKASLPFAMGLRACIGRRIAEIQVQTTLMKIVRNFDVQICNKRDVEAVMKMVLIPSEPLQLKFKKL